MKKQWWWIEQMESTMKTLKKNGKIKTPEETVMKNSKGSPRKGVF